jgi:predicted DNA-binding transcriptional regulator AlpA
MCRDGLPKTGFVRLKSILGPVGPIPVSKSTWWAGVASGRFPTPVHLAPRITAWRVEDIRELIEQISSADSIEFRSGGPEGPNADRKSRRGKKHG